MPFPILRPRTCYGAAETGKSRRFRHDGVVYSRELELDLTVPGLDTVNSRIHHITFRTVALHCAMNSCARHKPCGEGPIQLGVCALQLPALYAAPVVVAPAHVVVAPRCGQAVDAYEDRHRLPARQLADTGARLTKSRILAKSSARRAIRLVPSQQDNEMRQLTIRYFCLNGDVAVRFGRSIARANHRLFRSGRAACHSLRRRHRKYCGKATLGAGRMGQCLEQNRASISAGCKASLSQMQSLLNTRAQARAAVMQICRSDVGASARALVATAI